MTLTEKKNETVLQGYSFISNVGHFRKVVVIKDIGEKIDYRIFNETKLKIPYELNKRSILAYRIKQI